MPSWDEIIQELGETPSQIDYVRRKYLEELYKYTGRNVIIYYSGFLQRNNGNIEVTDYDLVGFMTTVNKLDCTKGLDLILHTPGGSPTAAEGIVSYLKSKFKNNIRVIVPHLSMSAGTMIACCGKEIIMGNQSSLGPIDPQFNGIPAYNILDEYNEAKSDLADNPGNAQYWAIKLQQYPAAFMKTCIDAIELSEELVKEWLQANMLQENMETVDRVVNFLNSHEESKNHGRHFNLETCKKIGLNVIELEKDDKLQDIILSIHHTCMLTFDSTLSAKIIENHNGKAFINSISTN